MQTEVADKLYSVKEYLAFEERATDKHEYCDGKILKRADVSITHNIIAANAASLLGNSLYERTFLVTGSDTKVYISQFDCVVYPDAVIVFEKPEFYPDRDDMITNPLLIVEVTSPSTKEYDRSIKFQRYKTLPSFKEYVLVEQSQPWVVASYKIADRT